MHRFTDVTITDVDQMEASLATVRERGWAISYCEESKGAVGLAVRLVDPGTGMPHGLAVFTPSARFNPDDRALWVSKLRACADAIVDSRRVGGMSPSPPPGRRGGIPID